MGFGFHMGRGHECSRKHPKQTHESGVLRMKVVAKREELVSR